MSFNGTRCWFLSIVALLGNLFSASPALGQQNDGAELEAIIHAIAVGWEQADGTPFRENFLDFAGARYIESGGQNEGLDDLVEHHVEPEGDSLDGLKLTFSGIETHVEGDFAWAIADTEVKATVKSDNRKLHLRGYQTFLFRQTLGQWKVVHTHSSSRAVRSEPSHKHEDSED